MKVENVGKLAGLVCPSCQTALAEDSERCTGCNAQIVIKNLSELARQDDFEATEKDAVDAARLGTRLTQSLGAAKRGKVCVGYCFEDKTYYLITAKS